MINNRPLVSIIIPAYNAGAFIAETLDSILRQSYAHWEAIIVDDQSTDDTAERAQDYARRDERFRYHRASRRGGNAAANRNIGLMLAKGELITFMDADDVYNPDGLQTLIDPLLEDSRLNASLAFPYYCDQHLAPQYPSPNLVEHADGSFTFAPDYVMSWEKICQVTITTHVCCLMLRRDVMQVLGPMDESLLSGEDFKYFVNLFRMGWERVRIIPRCTYRYRQVTGSVTKAPNSLLAAMGCHVRIARWLFSLPELPESARRLEHVYIYKRLADISRTLTRLKRPDLAWKVLWGSLRYPRFAPRAWSRTLGKEVARLLLPNNLLIRPGVS